MTDAKDIKTIDDLTPDPRNANKGTERGVHMLEHSMSQYGAGRSVVVDRDGVIIAGNKTVQTAENLGLPIRTVQTDGSELVVVQRTDLDELDPKARGLAIADNRASEVGLEWDPDELLAASGEIELDEMFFDWELEEITGDLLDDDKQADAGYSRNIEAPIYEPKGPKPSISDLFDDSRTIELIAEIDSSEVPDSEKEFLRIAARRHTVLNYKRIAEYYAHSDEAIQSLMENSALVIIDFDRAIELGYVKLSQEIASQYGVEYD